MANLIFRGATPGDYDAVMSIVAEAQAFLKAQGVNQWQNGYPDGRRIGEDIARGTAHVACLGSAIAAFGVLTFIEEPSYQHIYEGAWGFSMPYATVHRLCAAEAARGAGAAAGLLGHLEGLAAQSGAVGARADTHRHNRPMRRFLEKHGYTSCGVIYLAEQGVGGEYGDERIAYEKRFTR